MSQTEHTHTRYAKKAPRKLYLIPERKIIGGVCSGLAAYFNIDVTIIRLGFLALTVFTSGAWILIYIVMMLITPTAKTPEDFARAHGEYSDVRHEKREESQYADVSESQGEEKEGAVNS